MSRILVVGSFDPAFPRNAQIIRLLRQRDHTVDLAAVRVWSASRADDAGRPWPLVALRSLLGAARVAWAAASARRADLVLLLHPSQVDALVVRPIAAIRRMPVMIDMFISLHDTLVLDRKMLEPGSLRSAVAQSLDRLAVGRAGLILTDTEDHASALTEITGATPSRFRVLPVGPDPSLYRRRPQEEAQAGVVLFYGTYIPLHGAETIVVAAAQLAGEAIRFRMIGAGQERAHVERLARELGAPVEFVDAIPEKLLQDEIAGASICLGVFGVTDKAARVIPNKVVQCLAVGRPVITADTPAIARSLGEAVVRVPPGDPDALATAVLRVHEDPALRHQLVTAGRQAVERTCGDRTVSEMLDGYLFDAVAGAARARWSRG